MTFLRPARLHRVVAYLEMFTWAFLIFSMVLKYSGVTEALTPIAGGIHGFGFLCFIVVGVMVWINYKWSFGLGMLGLIVSVIPFAALPFALWADKHDKFLPHWRFNDSEQPHGLAEQLLAQVVRFPVRTLSVFVVIIALVFGVLLMLGPPVDVESTIESNI